MSTAIHISGLLKRYGTQPIFKGLDLAIAEGEFLAIVGVNGAGKTTLIKCLLDFCHIDAGSIEIFGRSHRHADARQPVAFLPERFVAPSFATGHEFLRYMSRLHGRHYDEGELASRLETLDLLPSALRKSVRQISKGMAQKLGLAATLLSGKPLFVLDEPMSGLDPKARALLKRHLLRLKERGQTIFFSTHLLNDVETLCDRIAILHGGELRYLGTPQGCCQQYGASSLEDAYLNCITS